MKEIIKKYWGILKEYFKPKEVQPLSAENAQALSYYRKNLNYDEMVSIFRKQVFDDIKNHSLANQDYTISKIPFWVNKVTYIDLITELKSLNYNVKEITELNLLIIYWNNNGNNTKDS